MNIYHHPSLLYFGAASCFSAACHIQQPCAYKIWLFLFAGFRVVGVDAAEDAVRLRAGPLALDDVLQDLDRTLAITGLVAPVERENCPGLYELPKSR